MLGMVMRPSMPVAKCTTYPPIPWTTAGGMDKRPRVCFQSHIEVREVRISMEEVAFKRGY